MQVARDVYWIDIIRRPSGLDFIVFWRRLGLQFRVMNTIGKAPLLVLVLLASATLWPQADSKPSTASAANPGSSSDSPPPPAGYPRVTINRVRISGGVAETYLIHKVLPAYAKQARHRRIQGTVILGAVIDKEGHIIELNPISGHPMLVPAALHAVQQWRYRPYILSGSPIEMQTIIAVNFSLTSSGGER